MDVVDVVRAVVDVVDVVEAEVDRANKAVFDLFIVWLAYQTDGCGPVSRIVYTVEPDLASSAQTMDFSWVVPNNSIIVFM